MKIISTILRDCDFADLEIYIPLIDAMRDRGHEVDHIVHTGPELGRSRRIEERDKPCDLHLVGMHYAMPAHSAYHANRLKNARKVAFYIFHDRQELDCDTINIQPIVTHEHAGKTIQAPFGPRPYFIRETAGLPDVEKDIDILWSGLDWGMMDGRTRNQWLDEFQRLLPAGVRFERHGRVFSMQAYAEMVKRSKINLALHGIAEHTYRVWETIHLGTCLAGQQFEREQPWANNTNIVMWGFSTPQEAANTCISLLQEYMWDRVAKAQGEWLAEHYNPATYRRWADETLDRILGD